MKLIRSFDFFTKAKEEIDTSTGVGGIFSILGFACGVIFLIGELLFYTKSVWAREMSVASDLVTRKEKVNIDVTFYKAPCILLSLSSQEQDGEANVDIPLKKERYSAQNQLLGVYTAPEDIVNYRDSEQEKNDIVEAINSGEYCRMSGNFTITELPGNFHFGYDMKSSNYRKLPDDVLKKVSLDLEVHHLSFGIANYHRTIYKKFGTTNNFSPYDGISEKGAQANDKISYFIKIVPNYFYLREGAQNGLIAYQFSLAHQKKEVMPMMHFLQQVKWGRAELPSFQINYEFSPITINYRKKPNSVARFFVDTLAIIGGIFSIMGMLSSFTLTRFKHLRRL